MYVLEITRDDDVHNLVKKQKTHLTKNKSLTVKFYSTICTAPDCIDKTFYVRFFFFYPLV